MGIGSRDCRCSAIGNLRAIPFCPVGETSWSRCPRKRDLLISMQDVPVGETFRSRFFTLSGQGCPAYRRNRGIGTGMSLLPKSRIGTGMSLLLKQHGGGQAPALRADGMQGTGVGETSRSRFLNLSGQGCPAYRRAVSGQGCPAYRRNRGIGTGMSLLPKQHGGGQAPALRADGMQGTGGVETHSGGQAPALRANGNPFFFLKNKTVASIIGNKPCSNTLNEKKELTIYEPNAHPK